MKFKILRLLEGSSVDVEESDGIVQYHTVFGLKDKIAKKLGIDVWRIELLDNQTVLNDDTPLQDLVQTKHKLVPEFRMVLKQLYVKLPTGAELTFTDIKPDDTVGDLSVRLQLQKI